MNREEIICEALVACPECMNHFTVKTTLCEKVTTLKAENEKLKESCQYFSDEHEGCRSGMDFWLEKYNTLKSEIKAHEECDIKTNAYADGLLKELNTLKETIRKVKFPEKKEVEGISNDKIRDNEGNDLGTLNYPCTYPLNITFNQAITQCEEAFKPVRELGEK